MSFLDDVQASINRGTEAVGRGTRGAQLKMQLNDLLKERQKLTAQLGDALYEKYKDDPAAREGLEVFFDAIADIDAQRAKIQAQVDALAAQAQASQAAAVTYTCLDCGTRVGAADLFCAGCGKPVAEIKAANPAPASAPSEPFGAQAANPAVPMTTGFAAVTATCSYCGMAVSEGDAFCMGCGNKIGS